MAMDHGWEGETTRAGFVRYAIVMPYDAEYFKAQTDTFFFGLLSDLLPGAVRPRVLNVFPAASLLVL